jgi:hypothetical protein
VAGSNASYNAHGGVLKAGSAIYTDARMDALSGPHGVEAL